MCPPSVEGTEQFQTAKLHGVVFQSNFYSARNASIASAVLATAIPSVRPSVRLSVCLSITRKAHYQTTPDRSRWTVVLPQVNTVTC